jgi:hypothetical protein
MPKKDKTVELADTLAELFADTTGNCDAILEAISAQWERLVAIRDDAQASLEWLSALKHALHMNKLKALVDKHSPKS